MEVYIIYLPSFYPSYKWILAEKLWESIKVKCILFETLQQPAFATPLPVATPMMTPSYHNRVTRTPNPMATPQYQPTPQTTWGHPAATPRQHTGATPRTPSYQSQRTSSNSVGRYVVEVIYTVVCSSLFSTTVLVPQPESSVQSEFGLI